MTSAPPPSPPPSRSALPDEVFADHVAERLAALAGVHAVALGGSRAQGTHTVDSDWDMAVYYRGSFDPGELREIGWAGEVSELGAWGGGVFNGGAWLTVDGRRVDVHYRDLDAVEHELAEARAGRFRWEPLMFHLAGIASYLVVAELGVNEVLRGELPRPSFPEALRRTASEAWLERARATLQYARSNNAPRAQHTEVAGAVAVAALQCAHAVLAARGEWVTNEKRLLERAGLRDVDGILAGLGASGSAVTADSLTRAVDAADRLFATAVTKG
ncbi:nucleotidyltransferase domain-containing protein [Streptomyces kanamyceticus]|uniref:Nucleotidyltransferase domain-containing protein n=1 Tax=Streptomyces kanamyceticus TaxID=1967 RepID=A0A5J6GLT8_STRKN|nr:nucleotidyltransferase domain-containing protein [Streptomyces kanamyceticus]QEU95071.1 nucleotidyltransferase domain-containing protein [Streptomyces kanamyceticus]